MEKNLATVENVQQSAKKTRNALDFATETSAQVSASVDRMGNASDTFFDKGAEGSARAICAAPDTFAATELARMGQKSVEKAARAAVREAYARRLASRK